MFTWLIPALVLLSVFYLALALQARLAANRLRREALALVKARRAAAPVEQRRVLEQWFFRLLPVLGAAQKQWVPLAWARETEKKLAYLAAWANRPAAEWLAAKELAGLAGLLAGWWAGAGWAISLGLAIAGFFLPDLWLKEQILAWRKSILRELPDTLDLLAACMEAGLGFEQAVGVILERRRSSALCQELAEMMRLIRMGNRAGTP